MISLTSAAGTIVERYTYSPFREQLSGNPRGKNPFRYCGEIYDFEIGSIYLRARVYTPQNGRFTQEDPHWDVDNMIYGDSAIQKPGYGTGEQQGAQQKAFYMIRRQQLMQKHIEAFSMSTMSSTNEKAIQISRWQLGMLTNDEKFQLEDQIQGIKEPSIEAMIQSGNLYSYCMGNPILYSDPTGLLRQLTKFVTQDIGSIKVTLKIVYRVDDNYNVVNIQYVEVRPDAGPAGASAAIVRYSAVALSKGGKKNALEITYTLTTWVPVGIPGTPYSYSWFKSTRTVNATIRLV